MAVVDTADDTGATVARFERFSYQGRPQENVRPRNGEFVNPILSGYYPDPSITRVGDDYYLVNSSFTNFPGLPVFHPRDLVNWTQIGNALDRPGQVDFTGSPPSALQTTMFRHRRYNQDEGNRWLRTVVAGHFAE